ncbi:MAG: HD domain-containing protein [Deferribacteraceae bacterium]|jgi:HD-GYP domain-containing protein (c-di-GMP phosphodiesterase class II)|nr:HD domain-containing protein [Deferribacteraceae bacterium]
MNTSVAILDAEQSAAIKPYDMFEIMSNTLSYVEPRLMNHGKRVANLTFKMLKALGYSKDSQIRKICVAALLHDIGAYKTEEIEKLVVVDKHSPWDHSIYSYLFLKYFSPLKQMAAAVLFHHAPYNILAELEPDAELRQIAQIIFIADRADILSQSGADTQRFNQYFEQRRGTVFCPELLDVLFSIELSFDDDSEYIQLMQELSLNHEQVLGYLKMTVSSIDYRSRHTVNHTIGTEKASELLATLAGLDAATVEQIQIGAMVHDLGKTGVPIDILESNKRLSPEEMDIMKTHINLTHTILKGHISEEILNIASRHHEKLNGQGYVLGLNADELSLPERILAVADVFSALYGVRSYKKSLPADEIKSILLSMKDEHLDGRIVQLAVDNYDSITAEIDRASAPLFAAYDNMQNEYVELHKRYGKL